MNLLKNLLIHCQESIVEDVVAYCAENIHSTHNIRSYYIWIQRDERLENRPPVDEPYEHQQSVIKAYNITDM